MARQPCELRSHSRTTLGKRARLMILVFRCTFAHIHFWQEVEGVGGGGGGGRHEASGGVMYVC